MSYQIPVNTAIRAAIAKLTPEGVNPDDAVVKLANKLGGELAKVQFAMVAKKEGSKPCFLKLDRKKELAKFTTAMAGDTSAVPVRVLDTYDWLRGTWEYADKFGSQGLVVEFPSAVADWVRDLLKDMKPREKSEKSEKSEKELASA